jgi:pimeloyl-ACP methyl ester carboxylesterase
VRVAHGNPGSLLDFEALVPLLAPVANLSVLDLPGFGRSARPTDGAAGLTLDRLADDVVAVCDALGVAGPLVVIGHSHGGGVAQTLAVRHPHRVAKVLAIGSLGSPAQRSYRLLRLPGAAQLARATKTVFRSRGLGGAARWILRANMRDIFHPELVSPARIERELEFLRGQPHVLESMVDVARENPCEQLQSSAASIRCPVLFLHGERDALVPPAHARAIHDAIVASGGQSEFRLMPAAGHMLHYYQAAELSAQIIEFLARGRS